MEREETWCYCEEDGYPGPHQHRQATVPPPAEVAPGAPPPASGGAPRKRSAVVGRARRQRPVAKYTETQGVLLTVEQKYWLTEHAAQHAVSESAVIRWALEQYRTGLAT